MTNLSPLMTLCRGATYRPWLSSEPAILPTWGVC